MFLQILLWLHGDTVSIADLEMLSQLDGWGFCMRYVLYAILTAYLECCPDLSGNTVLVSFLELLSWLGFCLDCLDTVLTACLGILSLLTVRSYHLDCLSGDTALAACLEILPWWHVWRYCPDCLSGDTVLVACVENRSSYLSRTTFMIACLKENDMAVCLGVLS